MREINFKNEKSLNLRVGFEMFLRVLKSGFLRNYRFLGFEKEVKKVEIS